MDWKALAATTAVGFVGWAVRYEIEQVQRRKEKREELELLRDIRDEARQRNALG